MTLTTTERKPPTVIEKLFAVEDLRAAAQRWDTRAEFLADLRRGIDTAPTEGELLSGMRAQMLRRVADALEAEAYAGERVDLAAGDHFRYPNSEAEDRERTTRLLRRLSDDYDRRNGPTGGGVQ